MNRWLKRAGIGVGTLAGVAAVGVAAVYGASEMRLRRDFAAVPAPEVTVAGGPEAVARGRHLALAIGKCADCHGEDLGGRLFIDAGPIGRVIATNLTTGEGGTLGRYTDAQLARAIRGGVRHDGVPLRMMPSEDWQGMSDADVADLIAYLRSVPPVDRVPEPTTLGPLGRLLMVAGQLPVLAAERIDPAAVRSSAPPRGVTVEYGAYLANVGGCTGCHRPDLAGGHVPGTPPDFKDAANLTPAGALGRWSEQDFFRALREGVRPDGTRLDDFMPWRATAKMTDDEIRAVWLYVRSVPPVEAKRS